MGDLIQVEGEMYRLVRDTTYCENAILSGEAILVDVGEKLLAYALPVSTERPGPTP